MILRKKNGFGQVFAVVLSALVVVIGGVVYMDSYSEKNNLDKKSNTEKIDLLDNEDKNEIIYDYSYKNKKSNVDSNTSNTSNASNKTEEVVWDIRVVPNYSGNFKRIEFLKNDKVVKKIVNDVIYDKAIEADLTKSNNSWDIKWPIFSNNKKYIMIVDGWLNEEGREAKKVFIYNNKGEKLWELKYNRIPGQRFYGGDPYYLANSGNFYIDYSSMGEGDIIIYSKNNPGGLIISGGVDVSLNISDRNDGGAEFQVFGKNGSEKIVINSIGKVTSGEYSNL